MSKITLSLVIGLITLSTLGSITSAQTACTAQYDPVCGSDGTTYSNACTAAAAGKTISYAGECKTGTELDQALKFAYQFGVTKYNTLTEFKSESLVTREQIAKMVLQFAKAMSKNTPAGSFDCNFTDLNITDPTLTNYIMDACKQGVMKGWSNAFHPKESVSYAQAITMLMRIMDGYKTESEQRRTPYELHALSQGYLTQALGQPLGLITRGELIILMNTIYNKSKASGTNYEVRTISDKLVSCTGVAPQQCMQISRNGGSTELFYDQIEGFSYVPGYTYHIQVVGRTVDNPPADGSSLKWSLVSVQSTTSTNGKPDKLPQNGCDWVKIDNSTVSVWGQQCDITHKFATISYDKALPGVIFSTKTDNVTTSIPLIHIFTASNSTGLQSLLYQVHNHMIKQGLVQSTEKCIFQQSTTTVGSELQRFDFKPSETGANCGVYTTNQNQYFIKPKDDRNTMIYINSSDPYTTYIDRSTAVIK